MKRVLVFFLLAALGLSMVGCSGGVSAQEAERLRFSDAVNIADIEKLDGKMVAINGYMATLSPLDGTYIYLLNLPYQSCPFCVPNTEQLANTMAVYAKKGKTFAYTEQAVCVTGKIELGDYTDAYGYEYNYRIVDAELETVDLSEISNEYALWQSIASDGVVGDINAMFDYLYFICLWTEYQGTSTFDDGSSETWYMYPGDTESLLADESQYGYASESADNYFPGLIARVRAISKTEIEDLTQILDDAHTLEAYARQELSAGNYTYDEATDKYTMNDADNLYAQCDNMYLRFSEWLGKWEI